MRRRVLHTLFAAVAVGSASMAGYQMLQLVQAQRVNAAMAAAAADASQASRLEASDAGVPEARFARALALAGSGQYEPALKAYKTLIQEGPAHLRLASLYNLGNLHLREALKNGEQQAVRALPLIELAKQGYRDVLRSDPLAWEARYNLERALWLAPEADDSEKADDEPEVPKERSITTMHVRPTDLP